MNYLILAIFICGMNEMEPNLSIEEIDVATRVKEGAPTVETQIGKVPIRLIRIEPSSFLIGSDEREEGHVIGEGPRRKIKLTKAFYLGECEVTQEQFFSIAGHNPSETKGNALPVHSISPGEVAKFLKILSRELGLAVTLPSEAQWEYSCRAGSNSRFSSGDSKEELSKVAWFCDNSDAKVHEVKTKRPNAFGLYDMHGNVWEMCRDDLDDYEFIDATDPVGKTDGPPFVIRGGSWLHPESRCRSAARAYGSRIKELVGFRICINVEK